MSNLKVRTDTANTSSLIREIAVIISYMAMWESGRKPIAEIPEHFVGGNSDLVGWKWVRVIVLRFLTLSVRGILTLLGAWESGWEHSCQGWI